MAAFPQAALAPDLERVVAIPAPVPKLKQPGAGGIQISQRVRCAAGNVTGAKRDPAWQYLLESCAEVAGAGQEQALARHQEPDRRGPGNTKAVFEEVEVLAGLIEIAGEDLQIHGVIEQ